MFYLTSFYAILSKEKYAALSAFIDNNPECPFEIADSRELDDCVECHIDCDATDIAQWIEAIEKL